MSDFLTRLAERAVGVAPTLDRAASRYGGPLLQPPGGELLEVEELIDAAAPAPEPVAARHPPALTPDATQPASAQPETPGRRAAPRPGAPDSPAAARSEPPEPSREATRPAAGSTPRRTPVEQEALEVRLETSEAPIETTAATSLRQEPDRVEPQTAARSRRRVAIPDAAAAEQPAGEPRVPVTNGQASNFEALDVFTETEVGETSRREPREAPPAREAAPAPRPAVARDAARRVAARREMGEQTIIRVSIGRVEVRSDAAPEPRQPAQPWARGPQHQSLDDYLRRRSEART